MGLAKDTLVKNMSKFQIGIKPGHRAAEHLFVIKSTIALYAKFDRPGCRRKVILLSKKLTLTASSISHSAVFKTIFLH